MTEFELPVLPGGGSFRPTIYWYLTYRCNLACKHCWVESSPQVSTATDLTTAEAVRAVELMKEIRASSVFLSGGDPLMRKDIGEIIQALIDHRLRYVIETNAMLITEALAGQIRAGIDAGVPAELSVSLDGGTPEAHEFQRGKGSFAPTIRGMERLRDASIPFGIQCVVTRRSVDTIPELVARAEQLGAQRVAFAFVTPVGRANEYLDELSLKWDELERCLNHIVTLSERSSLEMIVKLPPAAIPPALYPRLMKNHVLQRQQARLPGGVAYAQSCNFPLLGILPNGTVTICSLTRLDEEAHFGNIREKSLVQIWQERHLNQVRQDYVEANWLKGICGDCTFKHKCKGGCRALARAEFGGFDDAHPLCTSLVEAGRFPSLYRLSYRAERMAAYGGGARS